MFEAFAPPSNTYVVDSALDRHAIVERLQELVQTNLNSWVLNGKVFYGSVSDNGFEIFLHEDPEYSSMPRMRKNIPVVIQGVLQERAEGTRINMCERLPKLERVGYGLRSGFIILWSLIDLSMMALILAASHYGWLKAEDAFFPLIAIPVLLVFLFAVLAILQVYSNNDLNNFHRQAKKTRELLLPLISATETTVKLE